MESYTSVETPSVSGGEAASPVAADSSVSVETPSAVPTQPAEAQEQVVNSGTPAPTIPEDEFPDDQAFQQLPGEQRSANWQQARARIKELNGQLREVSERAAIATQLEELGGLESLRADADFARTLFSSYKQDESGNPITDPQTGMPYITAQPFIEQLQQQSPDTFYTMMWEALAQPIDQSQTVGDWLLQKKYGLDPKLLDAYKQIQSPNDLQRFAPQAVHQDELTWIPQELHDAYKTFSSQDRQRFQDTPVDQEQDVFDKLQERKELLENRKFVQETKAEKAEQKRLDDERWELGIKQNTQKVIQEKQQQTINAQLERLKTQYQPFGPEDADGNQMVYESALLAGDKIFENPAIKQKAASAGNFYYQAERYRATGNAAPASRAQAQADAITLELQREYSKAVSAHIDKWNTRLKGRIVAAQPQPQPTTPQQPAHVAPARNQPTAPANGFKISPERINQIAAQLALQKAGQQ